MDVASSKPGCALRTTRFFTYSGHIHDHGFTLVELLVSMAILLILISYALPSFKSFIDGQRKIAYLNSMVSTLYLARSEAIMRNSNVVVCQSNDGEVCITSGEWEQGWMVFHDRNNDRIHDDDETVLARHESLKGITLHYRGSGPPHHVVYRAQGTSNNGTFTFCDSGGSESARALIIYKAGRVRSSSVRSDGTALTCPP